MNPYIAFMTLHTKLEPTGFKTLADSIASLAVAHIQPTSSLAYTYDRQKLTNSI